MQGFHPLVIGNPGCIFQLGGSGDEGANLREIWMSDHKAATFEPPVPVGKTPKPTLVIRSIDVSDIIDALADGLTDFRNAPIFSLAFGGFYAAFGWALLFGVFYLNIDQYAFPIATGFVLIAPFVAAGCYEVSRRLQADEPLSWRQVFQAVRSAGGNDLNWMVVVTVFSYIIWIDIAMALYVIFFGLNPLTFFQLVNVVFTTLPGLAFFIIGSFVGAVLSAVMFSLTAVSFPILFDRKVDFVTAMITSVKSVMKNTKAMAVWGLVIGGAFGISLLSAFVALLVVLPVLGYTTWHLYRRLIEPDAS